MNGIRFESRESLPTWLAYSLPIFTILAALAVGAVPLIALGVNPIDAYITVFFDQIIDTSDFSWSDPGINDIINIRGSTNVLVTAVPLFLAGLAVYIPLKAGLWNIGAEGQLWVGAIVGTAIAVNVELSSIFLIPLMMVAAGFAAAIYGGIPGYLKAEHNVNEIISSLMLTFAAIQFAGYLLRGPMQGAGGQTASERLPDAARLPTEFPIVGEISPRFNAGIFLIFFIAILAYVLMNKTRLGYEITFIGANPAAAVQAGISKYRIYVITFVIGGFLAGLAGIIEIAGVQGRLFEGFSPDYGFTAIAVALLGRNGVFRVLLAALFFALLTAGGVQLAAGTAASSALIDVIVALVILFLLTAEFFKTHRVTLEFGRFKNDPDDGVTEGPT